jgi:hypothetical protein
MHIKILKTKLAKVSYVFYLHSSVTFPTNEICREINFFSRIIIKRFILITIDNACSRYYSKVQDWCRNSCGCCPCSFCKNINVELSVEIIDDKIIKKKDTPYGYGRISSYFNALATTDTTVYYREHPHPYILSNSIYLIIKISTDEPILESIISKQEIQVIGDPLQETMNHLIWPGTTTVRLGTRVPVHTTSDWPE